LIPVLSLQKTTSILSSIYMESLQSLIKTSKVRVVGSVIIGFLFLFGAGFLFWTISKENNLGPKNSDASSCIDKCVGPCVDDIQIDNESYDRIICDLGKSCISYNTCDGKKVLVSYKSTFGGKIVGEKRQEVLFREDATQVEAVANDGYIFSYWLDEITGKRDTSEFSTQSRRLDKTVEGRISLKAVFVKK